MSTLEYGTVDELEALLDAGALGANSAYPVIYCPLAAVAYFKRTDLGEVLMRRGADANGAAPC